MNSYELNSFFSKLKTLLPLANSHMVHFITKDIFQRVVPKQLQEELMVLDVNELNKIILNSFCNIKINNERFSNINEFLNHTQSLALKNNNACISVEELFRILKSQGFKCGFSIGLIQSLMSVKKCHEVELMSSVVAALAETEKCTHIVDIGGGKGYLSSILALKHQLKVLSIDSSVVTSSGAAKQIPKMEKLWNSTSKKASKNESQLYVDTQDLGQHGKACNDSSRLCKLATSFIQEDTDVVKLVRDHFQEDEIDRLMVVGLHTCGNLAASSLRLFTSNPYHIKCLVNVGCCYHLIREEFDRIPAWLEMEMPETGVGFPMSAYLRDLEYTLGRNARMLATQPPDRISQEGAFDTEILFYRALLEVYLEQKLCPVNELPHFRVGKLARKCSSFVDYVHKSIKRLGLNIQVDEEEVQQLYDSHLESRRQLHAFFLLRLAVAPAIEAAIMLDRLLYLHEQGIKDAYLVQLFDPVVSPRCFAIVAFNRTFHHDHQPA